MTNALKSYLAVERGRAARLADQLGIARSYISDLANGKKIASVGLLQRVASLTGLPLPALLGQDGFAEGAVAPYDPGTRSNRLTDIAASLAPNLRHPSFFVAASANHDFGILQGDFIVIDAKFDAHRIAQGTLVIAQIAGDDGEGRTLTARLAAPWLISNGGTIAGEVGRNAAIVGIVRVVIRADDLSAI
jgi:transcriptional regulator with XRE-family HTH domain